MQAIIGHITLQITGVSGFPASLVPPSTGMHPVQPQGGETSWDPAGQVLGGGAQGGMGPEQTRLSWLVSFAIPASTGAQMGQPQGSVLGAYPLEHQLRGDGHKWRVKTRPWSPSTIRILRLAPATTSCTAH